MRATVTGPRKTATEMGATNATTAIAGIVVMIVGENGNDDDGDDMASAGRLRVDMFNRVWRHDK